jgi:hypothetical protein
MTRRVAVAALGSALAFAGRTPQEQWRAATEAELKTIIPARAQVEKERIETEFRTASGITDGKGHFIAGVVLITAGYSAEGKYSHFLLTQAPIRLGALLLPAGDYVFGWKRESDDALNVRFYEAATGKSLGTVKAVRSSRIGKIQSFQIQAPGEKPMILIGRFGIPYKLGG